MSRLAADIHQNKIGRSARIQNWIANRISFFRGHYLGWDSVLDHRTCINGNSDRGHLQAIFALSITTTMYSTAYTHPPRYTTQHVFSFPTMHASQHNACIRCPVQCIHNPLWTLYSMPFLILLCMHNNNKHIYYVQHEIYTSSYVHCIACLHFGPSWSKALLSRGGSVLIGTQLGLSCAAVSMAEMQGPRRHLAVIGSAEDGWTVVAIGFRREAALSLAYQRARRRLFWTGYNRGMFVRVFSLWRGSLRRRRRRVDRFGPYRRLVEAELRLRRRRNALQQRHLEPGF